MANLNNQNQETQMVIYSVDSINEVIGIIDKNIVAQGVGQIRAIADILALLTNPYQQIGLSQLMAMNPANNVNPESDNNSIPPIPPINTNTEETTEETTES